MPKLLLIALLGVTVFAIMSFDPEEIATITTEDGQFYDVDANLFDQSFNSQESIEMPILNGASSGERKLVVICPGTGSSCMVEVTEKGTTKEIDAHKKRGGSSTAVKVIGGEGPDVVTIDWF